MVRLGVVGEFLACFCVEGFKEVKATLLSRQMAVILFVCAVGVEKKEKKKKKNENMRILQTEEAESESES